MTERTRRLPIVGGCIAALAAALSLNCGGGGGTGPTPQPQPQPQPSTPTVTALSLNPTTVTGGSSSQGTVTLSAAPSSATSVSLSSSNASASVPSSVTVSAGATTGSFSISTTPVAAVVNATVSATLGSSTQSATLGINPPTPLAANFKVTSLSPAFRRGNSTPVLPAGSEDACPLTATGQAFDCEFDGTSSTTPAGSITEYEWTYFVGGRMRTELSTTPRYKPREIGCGFFGGNTASTAGSLVFIAMRVDLKVRDSAGNTSVFTSNQNVRIFPNGVCGYGF